MFLYLFTTHFHLITNIFQPPRKIFFQAVPQLKYGALLKNVLSFYLTQLQNRGERKKKIEYLIIYRGTARLLAVVCICFYPTCFSPPVCKSSLFNSVFLCAAGRAYWQKRGGWGRGRSQIKRRRESLVSINHQQEERLCYGICRTVKKPK